MVIVDSTVIRNDNISTDNSDNILIEANNYLSAGKLDSAMALYQLILSENPLHVGALDGKEVS